MSLSEFLEKLSTDANKVEFEESIRLIEELFEVIPCEFSIGNHSNAKGSNLGSLKILAFSIKYNLSTDQTLNMFGKYYREDVINNPNGNDHQNIRH